VVGAGGATSLLIATPALAAPGISLEGPANVKSGQTVMVKVSGFNNPDPALLTLVECSRTAVSIRGCDVKETADVLVTNGDGTGSAPYTITASPRHCDRATPCAIFAVENPGTPDNFDNNTPGLRSAKVDVTLMDGGVVTRADPPPVVPEVPLALLLPLGASAVIGVASFLNRRAKGQPAGSA
jgi:hypothetical protein